MFWDSTIIFLIPAMLFAMWASANVNLTFKKYSNVRSSSGMTAAQAARMVLDGNGLQNVSIDRIQGNLTDHYDPRTNVIRLSESVFDNYSAAAIGIATHEAGHAIQHAQAYFPIKVRNAILPVSNIGSTLAFPLVIAGLVLGMSGLAYIGCAAFALATLFQLITLPVEFNASSRALAALKASNYMSSEDIDAASKTLRAAALTYVAALMVSLANLFRLLYLSNRRR
jgi:Predicted Zn-dependent protease